MKLGHRFRNGLNKHCYLNIYSLYSIHKLMEVKQPIYVLHKHKT